MNFNPTAADPRRALTLMELLISVTVIAILVTLLLSVITPMREASYRVRCLSSLRQMGIASLVWSQDHQGFALPKYSWEGTGSWRQQINDLLPANLQWKWDMDRTGGSVMQDCPAWKGRTGNNGGFGIDTNGQGFAINDYPAPYAEAYGWNAGAMNSPGDVWRVGKRFKLAQVTNQDNRLRFFDADDGNVKWDPIPSRQVRDIDGMQQRVGPSRHRGGNSWAMFGGRAISRMSVEQTVWRTWTNQPIDWTCWDPWGGSDMWRTVYDPDSVYF